jgi:hypothetical protein
MNEPPKQRWGCLLQSLCALGVLLAVVGVVLPGCKARIETSAKQSIALNNCKQIILALRVYSQDNGSSYADSRNTDLGSSNQVFRQLFKEEVLQDERVFGCPYSVFNPDNLMGDPPEFGMTLTSGECHWMLLKNQTSLSHPKTPIVIENSLLSSWPPKWDVSNSFLSWWSGNTRRTKGKSWFDRKIIIGRNDGSVRVEKLREDGTLDWRSPPNLDEHGKSWIDSLTPEQIAKLEYWDIEGK